MAKKISILKFDDDKKIDYKQALMRSIIRSAISKYKNSFIDICNDETGEILDSEDTEKIAL